MKTNTNILVDDSNVEYPCSSITKSSGFTPLMHAVMAKDLEKVKELILNNSGECKEGNNSKEFVNIKNTIGWTALHLACRNSNIGNKEIGLEIVKLLLKNRANPNLQDNDGWTALMTASRFSNTESSIEIVELLLKYGANPNLQDNDGWTALILASRFSNEESSIETVEILLKNGANPNLQDNDGWSALMLASRYSYEESSIETVELLLKNGANPNLQDADGCTALMMASRNSNTDSSIETVRLLLKYGANFDYKDFKKDEIFLIMDIKHNIELEELKEIHKEELKKQKLELLEEIYAPGGIGMEVAKERFEMCKKLF